MKYIDAEKLIAEIEDRLHCNGAFDEVGDCEWHYDQGMVAAYNHIKDFITSLQQERSEANEEEKSWSLQIQAYLTTASDELYAPGKPLYTKEHHEGIHECMKMWQKLHQYYFSTKQEQPEVDLEKEIEEYCGDRNVRPVPDLMEQVAHHFYELGKNSK